MKTFDSTLYLITDSTGFSETAFFNRVEEALKGGVTLLQLREKEKTTQAYIDLAGKVHQITQKYRVPLIIDDRLDVAMAVKAEGVHLGQSDMPVMDARRICGEDMIIGATAKTVEQAQKAYRQGADYLGVGAIYPTTTKVKTVLTSVETLEKICKAVPIPVNAIGGLNRENLDILQGIDIAGICVVSAIMKAESPKDTAEQLKTLCTRLLKTKRTLPAALTIAGSDSSGGAGIQADLKTMTCNGVYAMSAITALTAQNTLGVTGIFEVTPSFLEKQLDAVFTDIDPNAVKIGMVASGGLIEVIAEKMCLYQANNIVVDPVMVATSGAKLIDENAIAILKSRLLPLATLVTPNIPEAEVLSGLKIQSREEMHKAAETINRLFGCAVLLKGGHHIQDANDLLLADGVSRWYCEKRIENPNTHGTGCTLSSAVAAYLAKGCALEDAVQRAKTYVTGALAAMLDLGKGSGPLNHMFQHK